MPKINYFVEDIDFNPATIRGAKQTILKLVASENRVLKNLNYIFCSDTYLLEINKTYLRHDYFTDVITFDNSSDSQDISGDIFISIHRVIENATEQQVAFTHELLRVMIHGVLHLCGFQDKTPEQIQTIRAKEDQYLSLLNKK